LRVSRLESIIISVRGNEKGRVERAIRYVRDAFFAGRTFTDLDDLNAQAAAWCTGPAALFADAELDCAISRHNCNK